MDEIRRGNVHMRPRWYFILLSALAILGAFIVLLTLLYVVSLAVFFLRDSGALFAPSFGMRGWGALLRSIPWLLILFGLIFFVTLEVFVQRYKFIYRKPLLASLAAVLLVVVTGGFLVSRTPLHRELSREARHGLLPPPVGILYRRGILPARTSEMYHGNILATSSTGFVLLDEDEGTTSVVITPRTRLPYGADFGLGERVVVVGDKTATNTVEAFGVRGIDR